MSDKNNPPPEREPVLLSEDHKEKKVNTPYVYMFFILLTLLAVFYKSYFYGDVIIERRDAPAIEYNVDDIVNSIRARE